MFFFRGTYWRRFFQKNVDVWYPQIVPGVWSLVTLHSAAAALKHLYTFCFKMLVLAHLHRSVLTQQVHSLGHLAFKWRSSFAKALAKLSPNFREKSPNSFYKMIHIYIINTKYKYLQCNLDMCTWTFAKTLARKKNRSPFQKKTLAETVNCIPKGLRKGNPFHGPFAQLSCISHISHINMPSQLPPQLPNFDSVYHDTHVKFGIGRS